MPDDIATRPQSRSVLKRVRGMPASDGAGVKLLRIIGQPELDMVDPFLMLDEFGSDDPKAYIAGFPDHPHRGFETVTYMLAGKMRHRDNKGNEGLLQAGSVQWMTAGRGIVHSEMPEQEEGLMRGFQLWINLPARDKMIAPRYQDIPPEAIPTTDLLPGVRAKIIAGTFAGVKGPVDPPSTQPVFIDLALEPGASIHLPLPRDHAAFAYVFEGAAYVGEPQAAVGKGELVTLSAGEALRLQGGDRGGRVLLLAGAPIREPIARYGPFVMNTSEEIHQAFADFRAGRL